MEVEVRCFEERPGVPEPTGPHPLQPVSDVPPPSPTVRRFAPWDLLPGPGAAGSVLRILSVGLAMAADPGGARVVHSHTWYANLAGHLARTLYGIPHVCTTHSLEPLRPWKAEQLGAGGYALSRFCERTALEEADAIVAVSHAMREDLLKCYPTIDPDRVEVIHNGIDPHEYRPDPGTDALARLGIDPARPSVVFVGRVTRQKGITHLLNAVPLIDPRAQVVFCAGAPDTPEVGREVAEKVASLRRRRNGVVWIEGMLPKAEVIQVLSHATVFCCPSVYEPLGIVNLEAMACGAAVVATRTGGIPEVVEDGVTGLLVPFDPADPSGTPRNPQRFARDLADRVNAVVGDPALAERMGAAGRRRAVERFSWSGVAERTADLYRRLAG
jgi:starch synthase